MKIMRWLAVLALIPAASGASAQEYAGEEWSQARIWLDRGDQPVLQRGDRVRIYYRTEADAHVAIFHLDTDGVVRLLHPRAPGEDSFTRGGRDYRLLFPQWSYWYVDEYPGKGFFFFVASPWPLDLSRFDYARQERSWDLTRVGQAVYRDPYLAMDDYVAMLIPDWESAPYSLDFLEYDVGEAHEYPRFLCYDCHGFRSYVAWNPYTYACSSYRVVVWNDPYFYPAVRYGPTRVVYAQPRRAVARFEFKERAVGEGWAPLIRNREAQPRGSVGFGERGVAPVSGGVERSAVRRPSAPTAPRSTTPAAVPARRPEPGATATPTRGAAPRPSASATPRTAPRPATEPEVRRPDEERPVLQRRPTTGATSPSRPPPQGQPAVQSRPSGGGSAPPASGSTRAVTPPRSSGSSARPTTPPAQSRPAVSRPPAAARPQAKPSGGSASRPSVSSGGGTRSASPPPRRPPPSGGGASS